VIDHTTGLMWQQSGSTILKFNEVEKYIRDLNDQRFFDYNDWRLPTLEEAMSLMEPQEQKHSEGELYIDPVFDCKQTYIHLCTADRFSVTFRLGSCGPSRLGAYYVRAVR